MSIPNPNPNTKVTTVGFKNCASWEVSNNNGARPKTVVSVVSKTGRSLSQIASITGSEWFFSSYSLIVETSTIESLIMIPVIPIKPITEKRDMGICQK